MCAAAMGAAMSDFETELETDLPRGQRGVPGALVDAKWLDREELSKERWRYRDEAGRMAGLILGYRELDGKDVGCGWRDDRHVLTVAGSRGHKGVSLVVPNLLLYDGSVLAVDPKGELARVTARARREKGQKVVILDPFNTNRRHKTGTFNPLAELDPQSRRVKDDVARIAEALIISNERDPHWGDSARGLVKALILYTLTKDDGDRHLVTVWKLLNLTDPEIDRLAKNGSMSPQQALWFMLSKCPAFDGAVASVGKRYLDRSNSKELDSVLSTALTQLEFLDSEEMGDVLKSSEGEQKKNDLKLSELKTGKATVYLCLPATSMDTHSRWLRVIINLALVAFERIEEKPEIPVLMVLDEFPVLGHMKSIETAAGLVAGFGVKLWVILQDLGQIERHYKASWQTFISNSGVVTFWSNTDGRTLHYISERLGQTSIRVEQPTGATPSQRLSGASGIREEMRVQKLLAEDEVQRVMARENRRLLVFAAGQRPVILQRIVYYQDGPFDGLYDPHE